MRRHSFPFPPRSSRLSRSRSCCGRLRLELFRLFVVCSPRRAAGTAAAGCRSRRRGDAAVRSSERAARSRLRPTPVTPPNRVLRHRQHHDHRHGHRPRPRHRQAAGARVELRQNAGFDRSSGRYQLGQVRRGHVVLHRQQGAREGQVDFVTYFTAGTSFYIGRTTRRSTAGWRPCAGARSAVEKGTTQLDDSTAQTKKCTNDGKPAVKIRPSPTRTAPTRRSPPAGSRS